jgi:hypothetical protein
LARVDGRLCLIEGLALPSEPQWHWMMPMYLTALRAADQGDIQGLLQADLASGVIAPLRDLLSDQPLKVGVIVPNSLAMFRVA